MSWKTKASGIINKASSTDEVETRADATLLTCSTTITTLLLLLLLLLLYYVQASNAKQPAGDHDE